MVIADQLDARVQDDKKVIYYAIRSKQMGYHPKDDNPFIYY